MAFDDYSFISFREPRVLIDGTLYSVGNQHPLLRPVQSALRSRELPNDFLIGSERDDVPATDASDCTCCTWVCCLPPTLHVLQASPADDGHPGFDVGSIASAFSPQLADFIQRRFMINFRWSSDPEECDSITSGESCPDPTLPDFSLEPGATPTLTSIRRTIVRLARSDFANARDFFDDEVRRIGDREIRVGEIRFNSFVTEFRPYIESLRVCAKFGAIVQVDDCGTITSKYVYRYVCDTGAWSDWVEEEVRPSATAFDGPSHLFGQIRTDQDFRGLSFDQRFQATILASLYLHGFDPCFMNEIFADYRSAFFDIAEQQLQGVISREIFRLALSFIPGASLSLVLIQIMDYELEHGPIEEWSDEVWTAFITDIALQLGVHAALSAITSRAARTFFTFLRSRIPRIRRGPPRCAPAPATPTPQMGATVRTGPANAPTATVTTSPRQPRTGGGRGRRDEERRLGRAEQLYRVQRASIQVMCNPDTQVAGEPAGVALHAEFDGLGPNGEIVEVGGPRKLRATQNRQATRDGGVVTRRNLGGDNLRSSKRALYCCLLSHGFQLLFILEQSDAGVPSPQDVEEINLAFQELCGLSETPDLIRVFPRS